MDSHNILSFLGLALRGGNLAVGEEPVETAAQGKDARLILLASDAADSTRRQAEFLSRIGQCLWLQIPFTKSELGGAVGRSSAALAAVTDIGLANALGRKLADLDPERFGEAAQRLELKNRRAMERREERRRQKQAASKGPRKRDALSPPKTGGRGEEIPRRAGPEARERPRNGSPAQRGGTEQRRRSGGNGQRAGSSGFSKGSGGSGNSRKARGSSQGKAYHPYARSRPVKKGKGSFRKREDGRSQ